MLESLIAVSGYFGRFPSAGYILIYLLCIPGFAVIYSFVVPHQFFHSTVQYESALNADANQLLTALEAAIKNEFVAAHGGSVQSNEQWSFDLSNVSLSALRVKEGRTLFTIFIKLAGQNEYEGVESGHFLGCSIENEISYATASSPNYVKTIYKQPRCENIEMFPMSMKVLFPSETEHLNKLMLWLPIDEATQAHIKGLSDALQGFPSSVSGVFPRMFYFSAVTITTLGYGDIVPITNTARTVVAIESILGIVLIGMFLNSLSMERKSA